MKVVDFGAFEETLIRTSEIFSGILLRYTHVSSGPRSFCGDFNTNVSNFHDTRGIPEDHVRVDDFGAFEETLIRTSEISMTPEEFLRIMSKSSTLNCEY